MALRMLTRIPSYYLVYFFEDETISIVRREKIVKPNDTVFVKGSRAELQVRTTGKNTFKAMLISFGGKQQS